MAPEAGSFGSGYLHRVLREGAQAFRYRGTVRTLLGYPVSGGPEMNFSAPQPVAGFRYFAPQSSAQFQFPDEISPPRFDRAKVNSADVESSDEVFQPSSGRTKVKDPGRSAEEIRIASAGSRRVRDLPALRQAPLASNRSRVEDHKGSAGVPDPLRPVVNAPRAGLGQTPDTGVEASSVVIDSHPEQDVADDSGKLDFIKRDDSFQRESPISEALPAVKTRRAARASSLSSSNIHIPNLAPRITRPLQAGLPIAAPEKSLAPERPVGKQVRRDPMPDITAQEIAPRRSTVQNRVATEEIQFTPQTAALPARRTEWPQRRPDSFSSEQNRPPQADTALEDSAPKPPVPAAPVTSVPLPKQGAPDLDMPSPAFWERRHLNHLRLRMRR